MPPSPQQITPGVAKQYGTNGVTPYVTPVTEERAAYNEVLRMYKGVIDPVAILPSQLRSEVTLATTVNSWQFNVRSDQPNPGMLSLRSTENRLDINDAFVIIELSIQFGIELIASTTPGTLILQTWANAELQTAGGFGAASPSIEEAYNGVLDMDVNTVKYMQGLDMLGFKYVDVAQAGLNASVGAYPLGAYTQSSYQGKRAYRSMTPMICLQGGDKTSFTVKLPDASNFGGVATYRVVAALLARGFRIQNGGGLRPRN